MNARYDDVIVALFNNDLDRAIALIETIKEQNKNVKVEGFELKPTELLELEKTTDFLSFHGWEAA